MLEQLCRGTDNCGVVVRRPWSMRCLCSEQSPRNEKQETWLLGSALGHVCKGQIASVRWNRSVGLCVFGCCNNKVSMVRHNDHRKLELSSCCYFCILGQYISL